MANMPRSKPTETTTVRLKPSNAFDLIRLLARSQSDPRKAVCELVQNSLDAQAERVDITWKNEHGARVLRIWDNGRGVFPQLSREAALHQVATTIGHSYKRDLTPAQRRELMALGKYGIGLIGFWCVGEMMEIRSRVGGGDVLLLRLERDKESASISRARSRRLDEAETFTEVVIRGILQGAERQVRPGRLQSYLASELRGQLLARNVEIQIEDRVSRGSAAKRFIVRPERFVGTPLREFAALAVPGYEDARVELYLVSPDEDRVGRVQLACGGTTVLDDIATIEVDEGPRMPWHLGRLEGVIDFPELEVAPGARRGLQRDDAANAFLRALGGIELQLMAVLHEEECQRAEQKLEHVAREIRRQFRRVAVELPEYDLMDVRGLGQESAEASAEGVPLGGEQGLLDVEPNGAGGPASETQVSSVNSLSAADTEDPQLFPAGPLACVRVEPARLRLAPGASRRMRATALDADGRCAWGTIDWEWKLEGAGGLEAEAASATYTAASESAASRIVVSAVQGSVRAQAAVDVAVVAELAGQGRTSGIPEPVAVHAPGERWRSRLARGRWEFNAGHRDYLEVQSSDARRVRYLSHLFAKEVVLRNFGDSAAAEPLERMVEILVRLDGGRLNPRAGPAART